MSFLQKIIEEKKKEVLAKKILIPLSTLKKYSMYYATCKKIKKTTSPIIISEFKRRSPSAGEINYSRYPIETAKEYKKNGASAISILTDNKFFGGCITDVLQVKQNVDIPILRKDFIIDEYQIHETKAIGADFILLIASCLDVNQAIIFSEIAKELNLNVLLEVKSLREIEIFRDVVYDIIGVNNRNLENFKTSIKKSIELIEYLPKNKLKISESGIKKIAQIEKLTNIGYDGFLIGESYMKNTKIFNNI